MANIFEKPEKFAGTALAVLQRTIKLPGLIPASNRYGIADFAGAEGDVVNVKRPPILRARDAGFRSRNELVVDDLTQSRIQIALTRHPYSRVALSPEEATLDEVDYVRDVQAPQVRAIAEDFEETIVAALAGATFVHEVTFNPDGSTAAVKDPRKVALRARRLLNESLVPATGRYWLVGSEVSEAVAGYTDASSGRSPLLDVDTSGLPEALREGVVGRLAGFVVVEIPALEPDESYFWHETAVAIATVAPKVPRGAAAGASVAGNGLAVTQVWDYASGTMADQSTVHAFTGAAPVLDPKIGDDGRIVIDEGTDKPEMEFVRAVKVTFGDGDESSSSSSSSSSSGA